MAKGIFDFISGWVEYTVRFIIVLIFGIIALALFISIPRISFIASLALHNELVLIIGTIFGFSVLAGFIFFARKFLNQ